MPLLMTCIMAVVLLKNSSKLLHPVVFAIPTVVLSSEVCKYHVHYTQCYVSLCVV